MTMRLKHLILSAALLGGSSLFAQNVVVADDFNDGVLDPMWTVTFDPLQFWQVGEFGGQFNYTQLTAPFGAFDERYILTADVNPGLASSFQVDANFSWNDQSGFNPGENVGVFVVRLYDISGVDIATFTLDDASTTDGGDITVQGQTSSTFPAIPANSSGSMSLIRDANLNLSYNLSVTNGGPVSSGSLGALSGTVTKVEFYYSFTSGLCGPCGPYMGQFHVDDITLWDGPPFTGPQLTTTGLTAGAATTFNLTGATPFGAVFLAYSLAGGGPTNTVYGVADLSAPIHTLGSSSADVNGDASFSFTVPAGGSGVTAWFQALDLSAGEFSNGLMETVL